MSQPALKDNLLEWKSAPSRSMDSAYHWTSKRTRCAYHSTSSTVKPSELLTSLADLFDGNSLMKMLATGQCLIYLYDKSIQSSNGLEKRRSQH